LAQKVRFLTDSEVKKGIALSRVEAEVTKAELVKNRKKYQMYSDSNKVEVIKTYVALGGNLALTAAATKIPVRTLESWKIQSWWKHIVGELKKADKLELSAKTKTLIEKSLELMHDRLDNGDFFYNPKTGVIERKPVGIRDVHLIAKDLMDRKHIIDKAFEVHEPMQEAAGDKLAALAERFARLAEATLDKKKEVVVTDVVFVKETSEDINAKNEGSGGSEGTRLLTTTPV
jgi:hypothetical protein